MRPLEPPSALGVIGGGQLGRMFMLAAKSMGYRTIVLSAKSETPASQIADEVIIGAPDSLAGLTRLVERTQAITVEFENVSAPGLRWLSRRSVVRPGWRTVWVSQNRIREKRFLSATGLPVAPWRPVRTPEELSLAVAEVGPELILKTAASGYDGKGQIRVSHPDQARDAWSELGSVPCVAEGVVDFACEISVIVVRGADGAIVVYPPGLNHHDRHILDTTLMPAPLGPHATQQAQDLAISVATALQTVGVLTIEFFVTSSGQILVNEIAPRPHNSGHLTIEAAVTSQFEQQVRALCGLPLGSTDLLRPAAMVNLLGDLWREGEPQWAEALSLDPGVKLHLYGKTSAAIGRKMGHLTVLDRDIESARSRLLAVRSALTSRSRA